MTPKKSKRFWIMSKLIFFDNSYFDLSLKARFHRQKWQTIYLKRNFVKFIKDQIISISLLISKIKQKKEKVDPDFFDRRYIKYINIKSAMDVEIEKKGGILANDGSIHTTANSYKNYLKNNGLIIKDWTSGSLSKPSIKSVDKKVINEIINKYF